MSFSGYNFRCFGAQSFGSLDSTLPIASHSPPLTALLWFDLVASHLTHTFKQLSAALHAWEVPQSTLGASGGTQRTCAQHPLKRGGLHMVCKASARLTCIQICTKHTALFTPAVLVILYSFHLQIHPTKCSVSNQDQLLHKVPCIALPTPVAVQEQAVQL